MREELSNGEIILSRVKKTDIKPLFEAATESINDIYLWLPWCHPGYKIEEATEWVDKVSTDWDKNEEFNFVIRLKNDENIIGGCTLNHLNRLHKIANLGYWVRTGYTGKGVATNAVKLISEFGFSDLKYNRIEIIVAEGNIASQKVAQKAGARKECLARKRLMIGQDSNNAYVYSLVKEDIE